MLLFYPLAAPGIDDSSPQPSTTTSTSTLAPRHNTEKTQVLLLDIVHAIRQINFNASQLLSPPPATTHFPTANNVLEAVMADDSAPLLIVLCACKSLVQCPIGDDAELRSGLSQILTLMADDSRAGCLKNDPAFQNSSVFFAILSILSGLAPILVERFSVQEVANRSWYHLLAGFMKALLWEGWIVVGSGQPARVAEPGEGLCAARRLAFNECFVRLFYWCPTIDWLQFTASSLLQTNESWLKTCGTLASMTRDRDYSCRLHASLRISKLLSRCPTRLATLILFAQVRVWDHIYFMKVNIRQQ